MSAPSAELTAIAHLLPEEAVGKVTAIQRLPPGPSGSAVYAVTSARGELVLRIQPAHTGAGEWAQQLRILRRAAALAGVAAQLRALHALDPDGVEERDPLAQARAGYEAQRARPGYPDWAAAALPLLDQIETALARDGRRVVSHNDLNPGNVLWDGARAWLVDWEVAGLTHPFYDLAALAMFIQLDEPAALELLGAQEGRALAPDEVATFAALRRLAALPCGLTFLGMVPDLALLPASAPTLSAFYADLRSGVVDLADPRGQAAFALALLWLGTGFHDSSLLVTAKTPNRC